MKKLNLVEVEAYVTKNIISFHENKLKALQSKNLRDLLKAKNPYLFKAKNMNLPQNLVVNILDAALSSSEEEIFGRFLEDLVIFIVKKTAGGKKSSSQGIDLEFENNKVLYLVSVKSGANWGNNTQQSKQEDDFSRAVRVAKQSKHTGEVIPVLGICYGKTKTNMHIRGAMKVVGQNFWFMISGNKNLYQDIIEPLGAEAAKHNDQFLIEKDKIIGKFTEQFSREFAKEGMVDWEKLVEFNSGNLDLNFEDGRYSISSKKKKKNRLM